MKTPQVLYKYRPLRDSSGNIHEFTEAILKTGELFFAAPSSLGDSHECRPLIAPSDAEDKFDRLKVLAEKYVGFLDRKGGIPGKSKQEIFEATLKATEFISSLLDEDGYFTDKAVEKITSKFGVLSLSNDPLNTLLWEHYGAGASGLCIGFDTSFNPMGHAKPVIYTNTVPTAAFGSGASLEDIFFFHKNSKSKWENEWRILKRQPGPFEAGKNIVREVIFGSKCTPADIEEIKDIIEGKDACRFGMILRDKASFTLKAVEI